MAISFGKDAFIFASKKLAMNTSPAIPPDWPRDLRSLLLHPLATALPGIPLYECITRRTSSPASNIGTSSFSRMNARSVLRKDFERSRLEGTDDRC